MKLPFAHLSQTAVATLTAAIAISLSIVLLSGAGRQGQAVPLLPALGGAVNQVAAGLESPGHAGATQPRLTARAPVQVHAPVAFTPSVGATRPVKHPAHRVHRTRAPVVRRSKGAPSPKASAPVRATPITTQGFSAAPKGVAKGKSHAPGQLKAKGKSHAPGQLKAKAHGHGHAAKPVTAPRAQSHAHGKARGHQKAGGQSKAHRNAKAVGQAKARGHSSEHHQAPPPGQAKKAAPTAPPAAAPTHGNGNGNGGGNGHGGGKK
jgi:hypothetical protein